MPLTARVKSLLLKTIFCLFTLIAWYSLSTSHAFAQEVDTYSSHAFQPTEAPLTLDSTKAQIKLIEISAALICQLTGLDVLNPYHTCLIPDPQTGEFRSYKIDPQNPQIGGVVGFSASAIAYLFRQPLSSTSYIDYLASNFGVVKETHAQSDPGAGFTALEAIRELWIRIRDITYIFLVIIFILIGMGIMLRVKIDPRTVMSIQNQLPKIIITIILITFSYPIAGFLIDGMWLATYSGISIITNNGNIPCPNGSPNEDSQGIPQTVDVVATKNLLNNPLNFTNELFGNATGCLGKADGIVKMGGAVGVSLGDIVSRSIIEFLGWNDAQILERCDGPIKVGLFGIKTDIKDCLRIGVFWFLKYLVSILTVLIVIAAIVIALFRLWFLLLRAFIYVIIGAIAAPLWIVAGLIPGNTLGFTSWLRFMAAHLLVFPAAVAMIVAARVIYVQEALNNPTGNTFIPPLLANPNALDEFGKLIAVGIIFVTPEILHLLRDALKTQPNKYVSPAIYKGFGAGAAPVGAFGGFLAGRLLRARNPADPSDQGGILRHWLVGRPDYRNEDDRMRRQRGRFANLRYRTIGRVLGEYRRPGS